MSGEVEPVQYEWKRPDGTRLYSLIVPSYTFPFLWPWDGPYMDHPSGPVQVWRARMRSEPELVAETPDGVARMVVYDGGRAIPLLSPRNP